ncbi:MAG: hypothetical protein B7X93_02600 [Hydrogenophilales bacterium 17-61-9]|nr:MAG: hypothetical protein B7X93_02600 [Hydrogenophilales bacterium 17-61-9]
MDVVLDMLLTQPIGLLSLFTILSIMGIGFLMLSWIKRKMNDPKE